MVKMPDEESLEERLKAESSKDKGFEEKFKKKFKEGFKEYFGTYMSLVKMLEKNKDRPLTPYEIRKFLKKKTEFYFNLRKRTDIKIATPVKDLEEAFKKRARHDGGLVATICSRYNSLMDIEKWGKRKLKKVANELDKYSEAMSLYDKFADYKVGSRYLDKVYERVGSELYSMERDSKRFRKKALKVAAGIIGGLGVGVGFYYAWDYILITLGGIAGGGFIGMCAGAEEGKNDVSAGGMILGAIIGGIVAPIMYHSYITR